MYLPFLDDAYKHYMFPMRSMPHWPFEERDEGYISDICTKSQCWKVTRKISLHCEQDTSFLKLLGYGFQVKTLVGSAVKNHDMWRIAISISCCPRMQNGLGGRAGLHVHAQPLAGPLNSGGGMRLLRQTQVTFDFIGSSHSQLVLIVMGRRPQTHERWGSTAISGASARTLKNESWLTSELALKGNQKFPSVRLCTLWRHPP